MFYGNINELTRQNTFFRKVLHTGEYAQLVVMSIACGEDIGEEVHTHTDQLLYFVQGEGEAILAGEIRFVTSGDMVVIPAGKTHNIKNIGQTPLQLFSIYAPSQHPDGTIHKTKQDALHAEGHSDQRQWYE